MPTLLRELIQALRSLARDRAFSPACYFPPRLRWPAFSPPYAPPACNPQKPCARS